MLHVVKIAKQKGHNYSTALSDATQTSNKLENEGITLELF